MSRFSELDIDRKNLEYDIETSSDNHDLEPRIYDENWDAQFVDTPQAFPGGCGPDFEHSEELFPEEDLEVIVCEILYEKNTGNPVRIRSVIKQD